MTKSKSRLNLKTSLRVKVLILILTAVLITMMFPKGESIDSEVTIGSVWIREEIIASTTFEILKDSKQYEKEKERAASSVYPIFLKNNAIQKKYLDSLSTYNQFLLNEFTRTDVLTNRTILSDSSYSLLLSFYKSPLQFPSIRVSSINEVFRTIKDIIPIVYGRGYLNRPLPEIEKDSVTVRDGRFERIFPKSYHFDSVSLNEFITSSFRNIIGNNNRLNEALTEYIMKFCEPNLIYSEKITDQAIQNARERIPRNIGIVNENERIVAKHDRITPEIKLKIDSYKIAKGEEVTFWGRLIQNVGKFFHVLIVFLPFIIYINLFRKKLYNDNLKLILIASIFIFISFLTFLVYQIDVSLPIQYLILLPVCSMLLTIVFDSRVGFYGTVVAALLVGALRGNDYAFAVSNIIAGGLGAYTVRDIKNRTQIYRSLLYILIGYTVSIIAFGLERFDSAEEMLYSFAFASSNALISPVLTYGLIIFIERIFKITTDLTLLELTDFNHPLLQDLARNAPGTFNHSITMATIVETTAKEIDANPLLSKVGAIYHDIGKSLDPYSFVENQINNNNIHEDIKPEQSIKRIFAHVENGISLAKQQNLPQEIIDFIPMHHGTIKMSYFYEKAKELYGEDKINIKDYRYPGPKPNSKETALVMFADACESAVRSLEQADTQKIQNIIVNLIDSRIDDGQIDDTPLTYRDIKKIKDSFLNILVGHHHKRIRYPNQSELETNKSEELG